LRLSWRHASIRPTRATETSVFKTARAIDPTGNSSKDSGRANDRPSLPLPYGPSEIPADLALVIERWGDLPEAIRAGITAMVCAAGGGAVAEP
jgi:hypothetical protein